MKRKKIAKPKPMRKSKSVKQAMRKSLCPINWYADEPDKPTPDGWCVPTEEDFKTLTNF